MGNWKKITNESNLEGKIVVVKTEGKYIRDDLYEAYWSDENKRWEFMDHNSVTCREWNGEPTHYKLV